MNGGSFDAWSRRRVGMVAGGLAASLLGIVPSEDTAAKKKRKKKKRCKKLRESCNPEGRTCCNDRTCGGPPEARFCCQQGGESCDGNGDCCNQTCIQGACALN